MADTLKSFLVSIGFNVDAASQAKAEAAVRTSEQRNTSVTKTEAAKREQIDKDDAERREKRRQEEYKREGERREKAFKDIRDRQQAQIAGIRDFAVKSTAIVSAAAIGVNYALDKVAARFEQLGYLSARAGASAASTTAFGYASSQLGSNQGVADSSLEEFGRRLRVFPGYQQALQRLIGNINGPDGRLQDTGELATRLGQKLKEIQDSQGPAAALAYARSYGFSDYQQVQTMMDPRFSAMEAQRRAQMATIGADPNAAAQGGTLFEQSTRRLTSAIEDVATVIETALFAKVRPELDRLANWITQHGNDIANVVTNIVDGLSALAKAFMENGSVKTAINAIGGGLQELAKWVGTEDFKKDVKAFSDDISALAHAVRTALEWLGIIPSRTTSADAAVAGGGGLTPGGHSDSLLPLSRAALRGRQPTDQVVSGLQQRGAQKLAEFRGGGHARAGWWTPQRQAHAYERLTKEAGLTDRGARAVISRWMNVEAAGGPGSVNPNSGAAGIGQWLGSRKTGFTEDFDSQLSHSINELGSTERHAFLRLNAAKTDAEAAAGASAYERAEGWNGITDNWAGKTLAGMSSVVTSVPQRSGVLPKGAASPFGTLDPRSVQTLRPVNETSSARTSNTNLTHNPTFNINTTAPLNDALRVARLSAGRGTQDLLRNVQGAEQ